MKSLPHASAPTSPAVRDAPSPSRTSPSSSHPKPPHPIPPPLQLPEPSLPAERAPPQLSSTFVSPAVAPSLAQPHNVQLRDQSTSMAFGPTLLAAASQPQPPLQPTRPLSARLSQRAQEQVTPTPDTPDEFDNIEIRFYPFPPPRHPLTYPLPTSASSFSSKPPVTNGFRSTGNEKLGIRKRLLARWRSERAAESASAPNRSRDELPSNQLKRAQSGSNAAKRKRARSSFQEKPEDHEERENAEPSRSNNNSDRLNGKRAQNKHDVTNRALSPALPAHQVGDNMPRLTAVAKTHTSDSQLHCSLPNTADKSDIDSGRAFASNTYGDGNACRGSSNHSPRNVQSREGMLNASRPAALLYAKSNGQFSSSIQHLQHQIDTLKQRRLRLEDSQFQEICRTAAARFSASSSATKEQRLRLKADIEKLSPKAIRDILLHISRRCTGFQVVDHEEVQLQIDLLSPELVGELELIVMQNKGQIEFGDHAELQKVRTKLWNCLEEYRRVMSGVSTSEPN
ncbi:Bromodomain containing protein [Gracilaria domingensis]|nr:Bromodomain containing protein [Gracilaria domingensis]